MTYQDHIARDASICDGQPVIRGTRVPVRVILGHLAHGQTVEAIVKEFPTVRADDVRAVIAFAAASAAEDLPAPNPAAGERHFGSAAGRVHMSKDFDEPLADFAEHS